MIRQKGRCKMKNREMIENYNGLRALQEREREYLEKEGKQLFGGRITITYAIRKNMGEIEEKIKPYLQTLEELNREYRDLEKEKEIVEEMKKEAAKSGNVRTSRVLFRKGKNPEEYEEKIKELLGIEVDGVSVCKVSPGLFDGLNLSSYDLSALMFMLADE